jgi:hypothetical protein
MFAHQNSWHSHSVRRIIRHHSTLPEQFSVFTGKQGSFHPYSSLFTPICFDSSPNKIPKEQCKLYTLAPQSNEQQKFENYLVLYFDMGVSQNAQVSGFPVHFLQI